MKTIYLECNMGAAGDMLMAALYELLDDKEPFRKIMQSLPLEPIEIDFQEAQKCGVRGTHIEVTVGGCSEDEITHHEHHHHHSDLHSITHIVETLPVSEKVKQDIASVYRLLADAEAAVHGTTVDRIHFHEVGEADAIADITGVCLLMEMLGAEKIIASPIATGFGEVRCAHGILPVPAPATARLLQGIPVYSGSVQGELCTPTGAALLQYFVSDFGAMPPMTMQKTGYGCGKKDFEKANCVRAFLGETQDKTSEEVIELCCNLDDMTPEAIAFAAETLLQNGALDVWTTPIGMKKNRPGVLLSCLCTEENHETLLRLIFRHTTTLGVRESTERRYTLSRSEEIKQTPYGNVHIKHAEGYGVTRKKAEFEDLAAIARKTGKSLQEVKKEIFHA